MDGNLRTGFARMTCDMACFMNLVETERFVISLALFHLFSSPSKELVIVNLALQSGIRRENRKKALCNWRYSYVTGL